MRFVRRAQAREIDQRAMTEFAIPGLVLMENAARGIAEAALPLASPGAGPVVLVCGPGNNGGDGFAAARHLANAGRDVCLVATVPDERYPAGSDAAIQLVIARRMGLAFGDAHRLGDAVLIVDALFGTGLDRPVTGEFATWIQRMNDAPAPVLSVDIPSGLDADEGTVHGSCVHAAVTATMVAPKRGFCRGAGPKHVGRVVVVDIGAPAALIREVLARPE